MTPYYTCQRVDVTFTLPFWIIESVEHRDEVPWYDHTDDPGIFAHRNVHWLITIIIIKAIAILNRLCGSHSIPIAGHYAITIRSLNAIRIFWKTNKVHFIVCTSCTREIRAGWYFDALSITDYLRANILYELVAVTKTWELLME